MTDNESFFNLLLAEMEVWAGENYGHELDLFIEITTSEDKVKEGMITAIFELKELDWVESFNFKAKDYMHFLDQIEDYKRKVVIPRFIKNIYESGFEALLKEPERKDKWGIIDEYTPSDSTTIPQDWGSAFLPSTSFSGDIKISTTDSSICSYTILPSVTPYETVNKWTAGEVSYSKGS
jgi:hypothetical protein